MEYQKFIPEGWNEEFSPFTRETLDEARNKGEILQGIVNRCDSNYNLYVHLGDNITRDNTKGRSRSG